MKMQEDGAAFLVDIGGHRLALKCAGAGVPTVVFEAGLGCDSTTWDAIFADAAAITRACRYDRAGLGASDPAPTPRAACDMAHDLHALLAGATPPPYVLVGHSFGGVIVRLYAQLYAEEVAGLVLLDSTHPDELSRGAALLPPTADEGDAVAALRRALTQGRADPRGNAEGVDLAASDAQLAKVTSLGQIPLVSVGRSRYHFAPGFPADLAARVKRLVLDLRADLTTLSSRGRFVLADENGHFIHHDRPDVALDAIRWVVEQWNEHERITLSARDSRIFADALLNPAGPNDALRAAFEDYKEFTGQR